MPKHSIIRVLQIKVMGVLPQQNEEPISMGEILNRLEIIKPTASMRVLLSKSVARLAATGYAERTSPINFSRRKGYLVRRKVSR
jgi:hypothetical protein